MRSHVSRGREHIKQLRNRYPNVSETSADLTSVFESFKNVVPSDFEEHKLNITLANTRARLHDYFILFCWSTWIISSGDRKQSRRFWCWLYTKYGDGGVDLSPIDLMKSEVFMLAAYLKFLIPFKRSSI
jgi:NAD+ synthase